MAHRRTSSVRFPDPAMGSPVLDPESPPLTPPLSFAALGAAAHWTFPSRKPKSYWLRTTFLALFALVVVSVYILLVAQPTLAPIDPSGHPASRLSLSKEALRLTAALRHKRPPGTAGHHPQQDARPQIQLNATEELAAVSLFIASLPQNMIPAYVDPAQPLDPQLILDFDTRSPQAAEELETVVREAWTQNPVVLYSKFHSLVSREVKDILADLYLRPSPTIIDVDERPDENVLTPLLFRLTGATELPILLVGGMPVGASVQEIRYLKDKGELQRTITRAGGEIYGARRRKGKKV